MKNQPENQRKKLKPEISAGLLVFKRTADGIRFLLIKDSYNKWTFPKGHVEPGESLEQAAIRETQEETGISNVTVLHKFKKDVKILFHHPKTHDLVFKIIYFFLAETKTEQEIKFGLTEEGRQEIEDANWFNYETATKIAGYKNTREYLKEAWDLVNK